MRFKYIIIKSRADGEEWAVLAPGTISHDHAVNLEEVQPLRAGFAFLKDGRVGVEGASTSLSLEHDPRDIEVITRSLVFMGLLPANAIFEPAF